MFVGTCRRIFTCIEITCFTVCKSERQRGVRPKSRSEICGEVRLTVLRCSQHRVAAERGGGELRNVVNKHHVGVQIHHFPDAQRENICQVAAGVVEWAVEGGADGGGDESGDYGVGEGVDFEF